MPELEGDNGANAPKIVKVNYPSNSHKTRDSSSAPREGKAEKKVEKVISGEAVQRKKPLSRRIAETFTGDSMSNVGNYILFEVALPAFKSLISDAASQGVERMLFGDGVRSARRPSVGNRYNTYTPYNKPGGRAQEADTPRNISRQARGQHEFGEIVIATRGEAEDVLDRLIDLVREYDVATVSDLYELVGITGSFTDEKWGWTDLRGSSVRPIHGGYVLDLPRAGSID